MTRVAALLGRAVVRTQHALPTRRNAGPAGAVLALVFSGSIAPAQPTPAAAIEAFNDVASYIRAGAPAAPAPPGLPSADAAGVIVTLDGRIVAEGFAAAATEAERASTVILAARAAVLDARTAVERVGATPDELMISLEIAGPARSLLGFDLNAPAADWQLGVSGLNLRPGLDGLIVRISGARAGQPTRPVVGTRTPAWMLRKDLGPTAAAHAVVAELVDDASLGGLDTTELAEAGFAFSRYPTVHVAQLEPGGAPVFLHRGGRVVDLTLVSAGDLPKFGARLAAHLRTRAWPGTEPFGTLGDLDALAGRYTPPIAPPAEQALAASAAFAWASVPGIDPAERTATLDFANGILRGLAVRTDTEPDPLARPLDAAAVLVALTAPGADRTPVEVASLTASAVGALGSVFADAGAGAGVPIGARGLVALAAVRAHGLGQLSLEDAAASVAAAYASAPPERLVALMPFVGFASVELAEAERAPVRAASVLRESRSITDRFRINAADVETDDRDIVGGIVFTVGSTPLPTWQTLRPAAFEAVMLRRPELTEGTRREGELPRRIAQHASTLRYLAQLVAAREEAHAYARPGFAVGGVRTAVWSGEMPLEASALGLWTVAETLISLDEIRSRDGG